MWDIAERELGDGSRYQELADYNNIENPNLIHPGQEIKIPPQETTQSGNIGGNAPMTALDAERLIREQTAQSNTNTTNDNAPITASETSSNVTVEYDPDLERFTPAYQREQAAQNAANQIKDEFGMTPDQMRREQVLNTENADNMQQSTGPIDLTNFGQGADIPSTSTTFQDNIDNFSQKYQDSKK